MKRFLKITGFTFLGIIIAAYLAFLFVLPKKIDLNIYKEQLQKLVQEQTDLTLDFDTVKIVTTPLLEAGIKLDGLNITLPDGSNFISSDKIKVKLSLPNLLLLTVRVSQVTVDNPKINIEIAEDGSQYKFMRVVEDIINKQKQQQEVQPPADSWFNPAWIRIKVPNVKVSNYSVLINDLKSKHYLTLKGDDLFASYNNMKTFKIKTNAEFLSDENVNITADINIDSFIPPVTELDEDDDPDYRADIGFVNPVLTYRDYDLKADVCANIKARQKHNGQIILKGYTGIENLTMNLSGYQLPKSFFRAKFHKNSVNINTDIYVANNEHLETFGYINYGKHPNANLNISSGKIHFNNLIALTKAFMDTLHIKNDLASLKATGYITANLQIKTNLKKLKSNGAIIVRDGNISNNSIGLLFKNINANLLFNNKVLEIFDTHLYVNDSILKAEGELNEDAVNVSVYAEKLPLPGLFAAFAPIDIKNAYTIDSGTLMLDVKLAGKLKKLFSNIELGLSNFAISSKDNLLKVSNESLNANFVSDFKTINGRILNNGLHTYITPSNSSISIPRTNIVIDDKNITLRPLSVNINKSSAINISGMVSEYIKKPEIDFRGEGILWTEDLKQLLGKDAALFVNNQGYIPLKFMLVGNSRRQDFALQAKSDKLNYITPVDIESVKGIQSIIQAKITYKGDRLNIKDTGLYTKSMPTPFTDDFEANMEGVSTVAAVSGTITKLNTPAPFINQINITIPHDLKMQICAFKNSTLSLGGKLLIFGQAVAPKYRGEFRLWDLLIPELYTTMKNLDMRFAGRNLHITLEDLLLNGSDIQATSVAEISPEFVINTLDVKSSNIDVEKLTKVSEAAMKYTPQSSSSSAANDIPITIRDGSIDFRNIYAPPLTLSNTTGRISVRNNIFYLNELYTSTLGGTVTGDISANLLTLLLRAKVNGVNFDVERTFLELMNMKDTLSGIMTFDTDLEIDGTATTQEAQMKGISGTVNFEILDGQLGPFGKLENLILAENIRESEFFQTALGGVINSLTSIQTSHFNKLNGHIELADGIANLNPITSVGPVMCMNISGNMNLITNEADMKLRARLGSKIADMLGPIAAVNPINLVKATPGLNVAAAKMFSIFCEQLSQEEMNQIPNFIEDFGVMSTTNFQVVLRGDTQKPLSLIKSFKWLATSEDIDAAEHFVETLPPPDAENPNATLEEIQAAQAAEAERQKNIFKRFLYNIKKIFNKNE